MSFPFFKFLKNYIIRAFKAVHLTCFSFICLGKGKLCTPLSHSAILGRFCALMYMYICICIFQTRRSVKRIYYWNSNSNLNQTWHKAPLSFLWKKKVKGDKSKNRENFNALTIFKSFLQNHRANFNYRYIPVRESSEFVQTFTRENSFSPNHFQF